MAKWKASETKHKDAISQLYRDLEDARSSAAAREHDLQVQITQLRAHLGGAGTDRSECGVYHRVREALLWRHRVIVIFIYFCDR